MNETQSACLHISYIFHYIYAVLHHPAYREKFADNLKRELPRIPFAPDFAGFAAAHRKTILTAAAFQAALGKLKHAPQVAS